MKRMIAVGAVAAVLIAGGVGYQVASAASPQLHACLDSEGAPIKIVKRKSACPDNTARTRSWNTQGQQGVAGPPGPAGPAGPQGSAGAAGFTGFEKVSNEVVLDIGSYGQVRLNANCPGGKVALGGSARVVYDYDGAETGPANIALQASFASSDAQWRAIWSNTEYYSYGTLRYVVTANCAFTGA